MIAWVITKLHAGLDFEGPPTGGPFFTGCQLQKLLRDSGRDEREPIYFSLHDWAEDAPTDFGEAYAEDGSLLMPLKPSRAERV